MLFHFGNAQNINTSLAADINAKFAPLEKNRIPHNILLDYGFDLIDVPQFDGILRTNNYIDLERYNLLYNSIVSSATQMNVNGIVSPQQELNEWKILQKQQNDLAKYNNKAAVVLNGLFFNYSKFNSNALNDNKIQIINDTYNDKYINGIWQNPYETKQTFAMTSPLVMLNKSTVDVILPATLWHTNANITDIAIDFGNNTGYKNLANEAVATTTYTAVGIYTWTYRIQINGVYKYCRQKVKVTQAGVALLARNPACGIPQIVNITATKAFQGVFGSATIQVVRGGACNELRNPLIVAEGLDTGLLGQAGTIGDSDINTFFQSVDNSGSIELENLLINNSAVDYDIIYINWNNGTDYIQRNAYVLEAVIAWVNANKTGSNKNVVLGQSMGGLIARYALRDMENTGINHDTSLYISHDSPHQGAHIPVGILHMGRHIAREFLQTPLGGINIPVAGSGSLGLVTIDDLLNSPAINQMLINNVDPNGNRTNSSHTIWQTELRNIGYPVQTRNIALSNASHCASTQGLTSNQNLLNISGNGGTSDFTSLVEFFLFLGPLVGDFFNDNATFLLGFLPGNSSLDAEFKANSFPSSGVAQIYKGRLTYKKTFLWLIPITRTIFNVTKDSQVNDLFIDNYPGGINPNTVFEESSNYESNFFINYGFNLNVDLRFNFIPVTSALDVGSGNSTLIESDYLMKYNAASPPTGNKTIPFINFTTSLNQNNNLNAEHISFNRRNGDWLASELDANSNNNQIFDCTYICDDDAITGDEMFCNSATYSVSNIATLYNWSIIDGQNLVTINSGIGTSQITITATDPLLFGYVTINLEYGSERCGFRTIQKIVYIGKPFYNGFIPINGTYSWVPRGYSASHAVSFPVSTTATSYKWTLYLDNEGSGSGYNCNGVSNPFLAKFNSTSNGFNNSASAMAITAIQPLATWNSTTPTASINWGRCSGNYALSISLVNECGEVEVSTKYVTVGSPASNPCRNDMVITSNYRMIVSPNPIKTSETTINLTPNHAPCDTKDMKPQINYREIYGENYVVKMYDLNGVQKYAGEFVLEEDEETFSFKVTDINMADNYYILEVLYPDAYLERQMIILDKN